jgi:hypothetical protein
MATKNGTILNLLINALPWAGASLFAFVFSVARNATFEFQSSRTRLKTGFPFHRFRFDSPGFSLKSFFRKGVFEHSIFAILSNFVLRISSFRFIWLGAPDLIIWPLFTCLMIEKTSATYLADTNESHAESFLCPGDDFRDMKRLIGRQEYVINDTQLIVGNEVKQAGLRGVNWVHRSILDPHGMIPGRLSAS